MSRVITLRDLKESLLRLQQLLQGFPDEDHIILPSTEVQASIFHLRRRVAVIDFLEGKLEVLSDVTPAPDRRLLTEVFRTPAFFPIFYTTKCGIPHHLRLREIPWEMVQPHASLARRFFRFGLEDLAARGGLTPRDLICLLEEKEPPAGGAPYPWNDSEALMRILARLPLKQKEEANDHPIRVDGPDPLNPELGPEHREFWLRKGEGDGV